MQPRRKRWSLLPGCPSEVDADGCVRGYRLIQLALAAGLLAFWLR